MNNVSNRKIFDKDNLSLVVYLVSSLTTAGISFLSTPLLIRTLDITQFGRWILVEPFQLVFSNIMLLGVNHGIIKLLSFDKFSLPHAFRSISVKVQPILFVSSLSSIFLFLFLGFTIRESIFIGCLAYVDAMFLLTLYTFRGGNCSLGFAAGSIVRSFVYIVFLVADATKAIEDFRIDSLGDVLLCRVISSILGIFVSLIVGLKENKTRDIQPISRAVSWTTYKDSIYYGFPILVTGLLTMVIEYADRYILKAFFDYSTLTRYFIHLKIASFLNPLIVAPFGIWWPTERFKRLRDLDGGRNFFRNVSTIVLCVYLLVGGIIWLFSPWIITWFAPDIPLKSDVLMILIFSVIFMGMGAPMNIGMLMPGKTHLNIYAVALGAIFNLVACMIFIPKIGIMGAAITTAISYLFYTGLSNKMSQKIHNVPFAYVHMLTMIVVSIVELLILRYFFVSPDLITCLSVSSLYAFILFASFLLFFGIDYPKKILSDLIAK